MPEGLTPDQLAEVADALAMEFRAHVVACGVPVETANRAIDGLIAVALDCAALNARPALRLVTP